MTNTENALFTVCLPVDTKTVDFDDATRWIAEAKNLPLESLDEHGLELFGVDWTREESELEAAIKRGDVEVLDSSYHALRPPFSSHRLEKSVLTVKAFRQYIEGINGAVELAETQAAPAQSPALEKKEQRQDRRLKACIDAGLPMNDKAASLRLPYGVGAIAEREGVTRQTFSTDVKAAMARQTIAKREGVTVHCA